MKTLEQVKSLVLYKLVAHFQVYGPQRTPKCCLSLTITFTYSANEIFSVLPKLNCKITVQLFDFGILNKNGTTFCWFSDAILYVIKLKNLHF